MRNLVEGTDYSVERYSMGGIENKTYWFMLIGGKQTYLCCKGPFNTEEYRDHAVIEEVKSREISSNSSSNNRSRNSIWLRIKRKIR